jgi:hypothetical protein
VEELPVPSQTSQQVADSAPSTVRRKYIRRKSLSFKEDTPPGYFGLVIPEEIPSVERLIFQIHSHDQGKQPSLYLHLALLKQACDQTNIMSPSPQAGAIALQSTMARTTIRGPGSRASCSSAASPAAHIWNIAFRQTSTPQTNTIFIPLHGLETASSPPSPIVSQDCGPEISFRSLPGPASWDGSTMLTKWTSRYAHEQQRRRPRRLSFYLS